MKRMILVVMVAVVLLSGLLGYKVWAQHAALTGPAGGSGVVEGTTVRLSSRAGGRIEELPVREGQAVAAGDLVMRLDCIEATSALNQAEAQVEAARQQATAADRAARYIRSLIFSGQLRLDRVVNLGVQLLRPARAGARGARA